MEKEAGKEQEVIYSPTVFSRWPKRGVGVLGNWVTFDGSYVRRICFIGLLFISLGSSGQLTVLHNFSGNPDGGYARSYLFFDGTYLYGMTQTGGLNDSGTIFKLRPDSSGYTKLFDFGAPNGTYPCGSLISDGVYLYGMTRNGGTYGSGTLFRIKPDGSSFTNLRSFQLNNYDAAFALGSLMYDGTFLYGMTYLGGLDQAGDVFKIKTDGSGFASVHDFNTSNDGFEPRGDVISDGAYLYGMTERGGNVDSGIIFKVKKDGSAYQKLLDFEGPTSGSRPFGKLVFDGTYLYGMTYQGGANRGGVLFKIKTDGSGFAKLHEFSDTYPDGGLPWGSLIYDGMFLYGMTEFGSPGSGSIFEIKTDGTGYTRLFNFSTSNGSYPYGDLLSDGTFFYGMTSRGGAYNDGVVFKYQYACSAPVSQSTNITFSNVTSNSVTVNWTNGNGTRRIVKIKHNNTFSAPVNGNDYTANTVYSGSGEQVVYNGTGNSVTVTGLTSNHWYWFRVYEASCSSSNSLYLTSVAQGNPKKVFTQPSTNPNRPQDESETPLNNSILLYPNPTTDNITLETSEDNPIQSITVYSAVGRMVRSVVSGNGSVVNVDMHGFSAGIYFLDCVTANGSEKVKVVKY